MRRTGWVVLGGLAACTVTEGSSDLLRPEVGSAPGVSGETAEDDYDFEAYKDEQAAADAAADQLDPSTVAEGLGAQGVQVPEDPPAAAASPTPPADTDPPATLPAPAPPDTPQAAAPPAWTPADAVSVSWGLRLLSTVDAGSPPRAIVGLPDGRETVVKAGDMLPDQGVVVLAVGRGVVQLGQIQPQGDHVRVESVFLQAMYPGTGAPSPGAPSRP